MTLINTKKNRLLRRVSLGDSLPEAVSAVSDDLPGNVAWLTVLAATRPGPANLLFQPIGHFVSIDDMGVYGASLWVLYKDILGADPDRFVALSNALQARDVPSHENRLTAGEIREAVRQQEAMGGGLAPKAAAMLDKLGIPRPDGDAP